MEPKEDQAQTDTSKDGFTFKNFKEATFFALFKNTAALLLGGTLSLLIPLAIIFSVVIFYDINNEAIKEQLKQFNIQEISLYITSWLILLVISLMAFYQIREIIKKRRSDINRHRANYIAIMIGLVLTVILIVQPFLDKLFGGTNPNQVLNTILIVGGGASGWYAWHLKQIKKYGEFFNVLLMTIVTGFCWYARLTAPQEIKITVVAFLLASLFRIAKDYLDNAGEDELIHIKEKTK